jgi:DNA-binding response OmpR family regulator
LLVDDDDDNLALFATILRQDGFEVDAYIHPSSALSGFKPNYYDLVILDYLLPTINGLELYRQLRSMDNSLRAIMLTASQEAVEIINPNEVTVIKKPIYPTRLVGQVKAILNSNDDHPRVQSGMLSV